MEEKLQELADGIALGYGWVGDDMLEIYANDLGIPYKKVEQWFNKHYPAFKIKIEGCEYKGWNISSTEKEIRKSIQEEL